ncbi:DUF4845 domain-containing protein [Acinetobacter nosocomialis]|jgi:hypothetical protein|uniref:DUF4845 domain-containing protein n=5 Tax=Acinetobacter calcoaceticus/baumannii complex TaxID=909768 RepID=A0A0R0WN76_ACINO|nr:MULTISPECIES: DUF4845 domain-containing protein [Acinetobacter]KCX95523.1 hypothetical protein J568_0053 [Acinetobacter baumannii 6112]KCY49955.1 hypothetical protein J715_1349 [Acinetobacter baumannii 1571545]KCZ35056.1 hypothetical protein J812_0225 [Acinetobacter baumannii 25977_9]MDQ9826814.1 DUF4845 domain-containing protein [Acinetobacter sp. 163]AIL78812.1 signal peptide protein [Acinetobacter baumannii]
MRKAQQGTSYLAILFGVVIFAIAAKAVLAVWPAYWDDRVINNQITELMQQSSADITPQKFMTQMDQRLEMNNIRDLHFKEIAEVFNESGLIVKKKYEVRKPFLLNIDLVLTFEKSFDKTSVQTK